MFKTLIIALIMLFAVNQVDAQLNRAKTITKGNSFYQDATDISLISGGDSVLYYTITLNNKVPVFYDIQIQLDSVSGTPNYDIDLKGKVFPDDAWTDLETDVTWDGTSSDTTILFQEHSTAEFHRILQLQINGQALTGGATADLFEIKVWE